MARAEHQNRFAMTILFFNEFGRLAQVAERLYSFAAAGHYECVVKHGGNRFQSRIDFDRVSVRAFNAA